MNLRTLRSDTKGSLDYILAAVTLAIVFAIAIVVVFNVIGSMDIATLDDDLQANLGENTTTYVPVANATESLLDNVNTFYAVGPIIIIVIAAVGILSYVLILRGKRD